ncbi:MAG: hypothetical protein VYE15_06295, partial [Myxococcota bacterium]|nr:hypothetical protein [Myxococcota bacterium]
MGLTRDPLFCYCGDMCGSSIRRYRNPLALGVLFLCILLVGPAWGQATQDQGGAAVVAPAGEVSAKTPEAVEHPWVAGLRVKIENGEAAKAALECEKAARVAAAAGRRLTGAGREICGQAYVALGRRLLEMGAIKAARKQWLLAAQTDPELLKNPEFLELTKEHRRPEPASVQGPPPVDRSYATLRTRRDARRQKTAKPVAPSPSGPRKGQVIGVGLGGGFDGLAGVHVAWRAGELVTVEVAYGVVFPVLDARVRVHGLRRALTPSVGVGMTTPLESKDVFDIGVPTYEHLYELGESLHL